MSQKYNTYNVCYYNTCNIFYYISHLFTCNYENDSKMIVNDSKKSQKVAKTNLLFFCGKYFGDFLIII